MASFDTTGSGGDAPVSEQRDHDPLAGETRLGRPRARDDAAADAMAALFDRGRPEDFTGVYLALRDRGYTRDRLIELMCARGPAYDPFLFAGALAELPHLPDAEFARHGLDAIQMAMMRARFADWYRALVRRGLSS
ncbi:hypothetical protein [Actinomadura alba]|uniref:Uncharacterized protein n=1 Tax=Actinomadura alba TaxID=406431 RepID=A0ABR7LHQ3_9ACTN|nr:hypothetical protein [Actinomadura alba]MBC6464377.1 hypothetical protein [Actinomadura alba]